MHMEDLITLNSVSLKYRQRKSRFRHSYHQALTDVTFNIKKGETLGLIGRNGCGKSTLLKILAGIYQPDGGQVIKGDIKAALLTLSAGFDIELTGFENAIICSMLLGFRKKEVLPKLEQIAEFSELGAAMHKPVKTYSSGMRSRLGFSIAVLMEADVLLLDEVLAVGDAAFKKKAERTMLKRIHSEQTVVLVSHSTKQISKLCTRAVWLENGVVMGVGNAEEVASQYAQFLAAN